MFLFCFFIKKKTRGCWLEFVYIHKYLRLSFYYPMVQLYIRQKFLKVVVHVIIID